MSTTKREREMRNVHHNTFIISFQKAGSSPGSRMGSRALLGSRMGSQSKLSQGKSALGSGLLKPPSMMNGVNKSSLQLNGFANPKSKVAPMENPEVVIEVSRP